MKSEFTSDLLALRLVASTSSQSDSTTTGAVWSEYSAEVRTSIRLGELAGRLHRHSNSSTVRRHVARLSALYSPVSDAAWSLGRAYLL